MEIFHPRRVYFGNSKIECHADSDEWLRFRQRDPVGFIQRIFGPHPADIKAVGFKIFYAHGGRIGHEDGQIWRKLADDLQLRVIHLKRRNLLRTAVSHFLSLKSGIWSRRAESSPMTSAAAVDVDWCLREMRRLRRLIEAHDSLWSNHAVLQVAYEDLAQNPRNELGAIQTFLELEQRSDLTSGFLRQNDLPLCDLVTNFPALARRLAGTDFEELLELP
jgi:hypothetical protein